jgi:hypothetical protein
MFSEAGAWVDVTQSPIARSRPTPGCLEAVTITIQILEPNHGVRANWHRVLAHRNATLFH